MHADILLLMIAVAAASGLIPAIGWFRAYKKNMELELRLAHEPPDLRVEELQRTVEQLAEQCSQLAESQDFIGRVLSERLPPADRRAIRPPEVSTPH